MCGVVQPLLEHIPLALVTLVVIQVARWANVWTCTELMNSVRSANRQIDMPCRKVRPHPFSMFRLRI